MTAELLNPEFIEPAYVWKPPRNHSLLPKVEKIARLLGLKLEPEQAYAVEVLTGKKSDGTPAALEAAVIVSRQQLKTFDLELIILTIFLDPRSDVQLIVWTSQELDTCDETFDRFVEWFTAPGEDGLPRHPYLAERLDKDATGGGINNGKGSKEIAIRVNGRRRRLKFKARSGKSGRGFTGDVIVFDEAFDLDPKHLGSLFFTLATRRRAMVFYGSSAGHETSEVLRGVRDRGRKGGPGAPAYIEWCAPGDLKNPGCRSKDCRHTVDMDGCSLDRRDFQLMANPMVGRIRPDGNGFTWDKLRKERLATPPAEFARERLGWFDPPLAALASPITVEMWQAQTDPESRISDGKPLVFAVEMATDRNSATIAVAGYRDDGAIHVGLGVGDDETQDFGTDWLLPALLQLVDDNPVYEIERRGKKCQAIVIDPSSPAGSLVDELRRADIEPLLMTSREAAAACGDMQDALVEATVWHRESSLIEEAIRGAVRRDLGDGTWAFGRKKSAQESYDITPAVAVTNARWGLTIVEPEPDPDIAGFY